MTTLTAAYAFVTIIAALSLGAIGLVLATTFDLRRTVRAAPPNADS
jgi:hypothetical protein